MCIFGVGIRHRGGAILESPLFQSFEFVCAPWRWRVALDTHTNLAFGYHAFRDEERWRPLCSMWSSCVHPVFVRHGRL